MEQTTRGTAQVRGRPSRAGWSRAIAVMGTITWLWWFVVTTAPSAEAVVAAVDAPVVRPTATSTASLSPGQSAWLALGWTSDRTVTDWSTTVRAPSGVTVSYPATRGGRDTSLFASSTLVGGIKDFVAIRVAVPYTQTRSFTLTVTSTYRWAPSTTETPKDSPTDHDNGSGNDRDRTGPSATPTATPTRAATPTPTPTPTPTRTVGPAPTATPMPIATSTVDAPRRSSTPTPTPATTATPDASTRDTAASRSAARDAADGTGDAGRTYSTTVQITVPVQPATGPAVSLQTTEITATAGSNDFHRFALLGGGSDLADVTVALGTLPSGLTVAYAGDRSASGLNGGSSLVALSTDYAAVRLDTSTLPRGTYTLPVVVRYRTTTAQTWTGTVTLRVS